MTEEFESQLLELTPDQIEIVFQNMFHKCSDCKNIMQPLSTTCAYCRSLNPPKIVITPFKPVLENSFFEHFEIKKCEIHESHTVWFCVHPKADSQHKDLLQVCTSCLRDQQNADLR